MQGYNCVMIYSPDRKRLLFLKRVKDPYKGLFNLPGGKIEKGEDGFAAAYRELEEETGITRNDIVLFHLMDFSYYNEQRCCVQIYAGVLEHEVILRQELHPLLWMDADGDFFDMKCFAGEGNIGHMEEQVRRWGFGTPEGAVTDEQ